VWKKLAKIRLGHFFLQKEPTKKTSTFRMQAITSETVTNIDNFLRPKVTTSLFSPKSTFGTTLRGD